MLRATNTKAPLQHFCNSGNIYRMSCMSLRSTSSHQLSVPCDNLTSGSRAFQFSAPRVWTSLPVSIRESQSLHSQLSDVLFLFSAFQHFSCPLPRLEYLRPRARILLRLWLYISHVLTYLLTYLKTNQLCAAQLLLCTLSRQMYETAYKRSIFSQQ